MGTQHSRNCARNEKLYTEHQIKEDFTIFFDQMPMREKIPEKCSSAFFTGNLLGYSLHLESSESSESIHVEFSESSESIHVEPSESNESIHVELVSLFMLSLVCLVNLYMLSIVSLYMFSLVSLYMLSLVSLVSHRLLYKWTEHGNSSSITTDPIPDETPTITKPRFSNFLRHSIIHFYMFLYVVTCFLRVTVSLLCRLQAVSMIVVQIYPYLISEGRRNCSTL